MLFLTNFGAWNPFLDQNLQLKPHEIQNMITIGYSEIKKKYSSSKVPCDVTIFVALVSIMSF